MVGPTRPDAFAVAVRLLVMQACAFADTATTLVAVGRGAVEGNPVLAPLLAISPLLFVAVRLGAVGLVWGALVWRRAPGWVYWLFAGSSVVAAAWNLSVIVRGG